MARLPRLVIPGQPHHILQRGNNRQPIFLDGEDFRTYLDTLKECAHAHGVAIHAYVLMSNHVHLLASPSDDTGLSRMMQSLGRRYVGYFNHRHQRTGTLWEGRFKATVIDSERYFLACSRYIELNPVRAGMAVQPEDYPWSSFAHHVGLHPDPLVTDHPVYWTLGNTPFEREAAYRVLFEQALTPQEIQSITEATLKGWALGSSGFVESLRRQTDRRLQPLQRGRPRKPSSLAD